MTSFQPELWVDDGGAAIAFYAGAFDARVDHRVGGDDDLVAQLSIDEASFWISTASPANGRLSPGTAGGTTGRVLLVVDDPHAVVARAVAAGAVELGSVADEHGWRLGRVRDPFGHEWEIGHPLGRWPPDSASPSGPHAGR